MPDLTLTGQQLLEARAGLLAIGARELGVKTAYAIAKIKRQAQSAMEDIEAVRIQLCARYAEQDASGQPVQKDGAYVFADPTAFQAAWKALLAEPVTLAGVRPITLAELDGLAVTPDELFQLGPFLAVPEMENS